MIVFSSADRFEKISDRSRPRAIVRNFGVSGEAVRFQAPLNYLECGQPLYEFLDRFPTVSYEDDAAARESVNYISLKEVA
jgi:hypothetical protein